MLNNDDFATCTLSFYLLAVVGQVMTSCISKVPSDSMLYMASLHLLLLLLNVNNFPAKQYFPCNSPGKNKRPSPAHTPIQPAFLEGLLEGTLHSSEWRKATAWLESI